MDGNLTKEDFEKIRLEIKEAKSKIITDNADRFILLRHEIENLKLLMQDCINTYNASSKKG
jgi:hypothetical protein